MNFRNFHTCAKLLYQKPKNLKNKKHSSQQWIVRQLKDPYVEKAKQENYRCRSAFKLLEIQEKYQLIIPGHTVIDCGAAPGSWTQVAVRCSNSTGVDLDVRVGTVIAIDKQSFHPIPGAIILNNADFTKKLSQERLKGALNDKLADVILSDMAPNSTGIKDMDHENIIKIGYEAFKFALYNSAYDASLVIKFFDGPLANNFENDIKKFYKIVKIVKPDATRDESFEKYFVARGFKGLSARSKITD